MFIFLKLIKWAIVLLIVWLVYFFFTQSAPVRTQLDKLNKKAIALTFDDGPVDGTLQLLDMLQELNIKATFFVIGEEIQKRPDLLKRIQDEGHTIGNHTWNHPHFLGYRSRSFINEQMDQTSEIIKNTIGRNPLYMRTPFGESSPYSNWIVKQKNMIPVYWTMSTKDWSTNFTTELLHKRFSTIDQSEVILLHDRIYAKPEMLEELKASLQDLKNRGFEFITVEQLYF